MAQKTSTSFGTFNVPAVYVNQLVEQSNAALAATGNLVLIGEANEGIDFSQESNIRNNFFGPDQSAEVAAKYGSGRLVDMFNVAAAPSSQIAGGPQRIWLLKTNASVAASRDLSQGVADYGSFEAVKAGEAGNQIKVEIEDVPETLPTATFTWINNVAACAGEVRVNGGSALSLAISTNSTAATVASALNALAGVGATGGTDRSCAPASGTLAVAVNGLVVTVTSSAGWAATPSVGDTLVIPAASVIKGGSNENVGAYIITAATSTTITATKKSDAGKGGAVAGTVTSPVAVSAVSISGTPANDIAAFAPIVFSMDAGSVIEGAGKSIELAETSAADLLSRYLLNSSTGAVAGIVSTSSAPTVIASGSERGVIVNVTRTSDQLQNEIEVNGQVALLIGYQGTTATLTITDTALTTTVTGGSGANLNVSLRTFDFLSDLATFINSQTGYVCSVVNAAIGGQYTPAELDNVSALGIATTNGAKVGRVKVDAANFFEAVSQGTSVVEFLDSAGDNVAAAKGLPDALALGFLTGGSLGGTSDADVVSALLACEKIPTNFIVPLFSQDAADDIALEETDASSTYTIAAINAAVSAHVIKMSTPKYGRRREGVVSHLGTYQEAKDAVNALASNNRVSLAFQNVTLGGVDTQPYATATLAAAAQLGSGYKPFFNKALLIGNAEQAAGDWDAANLTELGDALESGLLPIKPLDTGGFVFASDQTSWTRDNNFFYNSIQAQYAFDVVCASVQQNLDRVIGSSTSDVGAADVKSAVVSVFQALANAKYLSTKDPQAPAGYRNLKVTQNGGVFAVSAEVKLAGAVYFITAEFTATPITA